MRLSEWRKKAPVAEAVAKPVMAVVETLLQDLGGARDPDCWVIWGEDAGMRYSILAPALAGVVSVAVRPSGSAEGPRATGKLIRWSKLNVTELSIEATGPNRIVAVQVESWVLKGVDEEADRICEFVRGLVAAIENRLPSPAQVVVAGSVLAAAPVVVDSAVGAVAAADGEPAVVRAGRSTEPNSKAPRPVRPKTGATEGEAAAGSSVRGTRARKATEPAATEATSTGAVPAPDGQNGQPHAPTEDRILQAVAQAMAEPEPPAAESAAPIAVPPAMTELIGASTPTQVPALPFAPAPAMTELIGASTPTRVPALPFGPAPDLPDRAAPMGGAGSPEPPAPAPAPAVPAEREPLAREGWIAPRPITPPPPDPKKKPRWMP